ncbi:MAG TPA: bifunctional oligoribonuclease/PAP phosphatase NrnA [Ktedonobacterales bacterium]|nr:bifunctional oligoribonuclease/PAP phosphatase NrnA [Ktedonobacterales bacterium]
MTTNESARRERMAALLAREIDASLAEQAWALIERARRIVLLAHEKPDPDALGSALGLAWALRPLGKQCVVACADPVPANYGFLPGHETVVTELPDEAFDLVIALDAGELTRYGALYARHKAFLDSATLLNMDHHVTSPGIGDCAIIDVASAATAELLTIFLLNRGVAIGQEAAICLLAGIITDTRAFEFDATTDRTLVAGAYLVSLGAVPEEIIKPMYRMKPLAKGRLWGRALQSLGSASEGRIVWAAIRQSDLAASGATPDMDEGLVNFLLDTEGVALAALFRETPDGATRASLRTVAPYDAAAICAQFGGGGHVRASGCTLRMDIDEAQRVFVAALETALRERQG